MKPGAKDRTLHDSIHMKSTRPGDVAHRQSPGLASLDLISGSQVGREAGNSEEGEREGKKTRTEQVLEHLESRLVFKGRDWWVRGN